MFSTMMLMMLTGQRVFGAIGFVAVVAALCALGHGRLGPWAFRRHEADEVVCAADAADVHLHGLRHVGSRASPTTSTGCSMSGSGRCPAASPSAPSLLMVLISAMNGLSVAGMAIGATIALPRAAAAAATTSCMISGVIQAGSSLGILIPPSVVLVLYAMIARQPVGQLWLAGILPGLLMAAIFIIYIAIRCRLNPALGPPLSKEERASISWAEKVSLLRAGIAARLHLRRHDRALRHGLGQPDESFA